jgi:TRAP-type C4-dicarboxylate transport system substrate-binding protein
MTVTRREGLAGLLAGVAAVALPAIVKAEEPQKLRFAFPGPPSSPNLLRGLRPWAEQVEKDADGALKIEIVTGGRLASLGNTYDRLLSGVFDIGYTTQGLIGGKFPGTEVVAMPFIVDRSVTGSIALWQLYAKGILAAEYSGVIPLALYTYPPDALHFRRPVKTLEELKGLKVASSGQISSAILSALGAVPVSVPTTDNYQAVSRGVVDGVDAAWTAVTQFKLEEVTNYHLDAPITSIAGVVMMNKQSHDKLPAKAREAIDKNSGLVFSRKFGEVLDGVATEQHDQVAALTGQTMARLDAAELDRWRKATAAIVDDWVKQVPNGGKLLDAFHQELAEAQRKIK